MHRREFLEQSTLAAIFLYFPLLENRTNSNEFSPSYLRLREQSMTQYNNEKVFASAQSIALGIPWEGILYIQEYWHQNIPYYMIANLSSKNIEVSFSEWTSKIRDQLAGPYVIKPHSLQFQQISNLVKNNDDSLIVVSLDENLDYGLFRSPQPIILPNHLEKSHFFSTIYGLNGTGDRNSNLYFSQEHLILGADDLINLNLIIPATLDTISFLPTEIPLGLDRVRIISARSDSLSIKEDNGLLVIGENKNKLQDWHEVTLSIKLPKVSSKTIACLLGRVKNSNGTSFSFARAFAVKNLLNDKV
jgi:hypothetical protein